MNRKFKKKERREQYFWLILWIYWKAYTLHLTYVNYNDDEALENESYKHLSSGLVGQIVNE